MRRHVTYTRCSTAEQHKSGLGLEAQQRDIKLFLENYSDVPWEVIGAFSDTGSGADNGRPEFAKAVALAKKAGAELLVAKLDRLSRKVKLIAQLMDDPKLKIRVASMPHADKFQLYIYAALAEQERDFISTRTKAALRAAKARGVKLGGYREGSLDARNAAVQAQADRDAQLAQIAGELDKQGISTPRGGSWTATAVRRALARMEADTPRPAPAEDESEIDESQGVIWDAVRRGQRLSPRLTNRRVTPVPYHPGIPPPACRKAGAGVGCGVPDFRARLVFSALNTSVDFTDMWSKPMFHERTAIPAMAQETGRDLRQPSWRQWSHHRLSERQEVAIADARGQQGAWPGPCRRDQEAAGAEVA